MLFLRLSGLPAIGHNMWAGGRFSGAAHAFLAAGESERKVGDALLRFIEEDDGERGGALTVALLILVRGKDPPPPPPAIEYYHCFSYSTRLIIFPALKNAYINKVPYAQRDRFNCPKHLLHLSRVGLVRQMIAQARNSTGTRRGRIAGFGLDGRRTSTY